MESSGDIQLGSLDWLKAPEAQASFSSSEEQIGAISGEGEYRAAPASRPCYQQSPFHEAGEVTEARVRR